MARWERGRIAELLTQPTVHVDETSLRVDRKNHWIHVYSAGDVTLKFLHRRLCVRVAPDWVVTMVFCRRLAPPP